MAEAARRAEALLFVAAEAVSKRDLARALGVEAPHELDTVLASLEQTLTGRGLCLIDDGTTVQLATSPQVAAFLQREAGPDQLSAAALETLTIVAYCGPMTRPAIDGIRGVDSRRTLRQLVLRGLIERTAAPRGVRVYDVTTDFLRHVGVQRKTDLPNFQEFTAHERIGSRLPDSPI